MTSTVTAKVDIRVAKSASPTTIPAGAPLTYVATVTNDGPSTAQATNLVDTLPTNATFISATAWLVLARRRPLGRWVERSVAPVGSINSGSQQTVTYKVRPLLSAVGGNFRTRLR